MYATHLRTEYLENPLGLGIAAPRFYWHCQDGQLQSAYQILCQLRGTVVWDSGKVVSLAMTHIRYQGTALHSRDRVSWRVRLWDENDQPGEWAEAWFELGLLEPSDWTARWITGNYRPKGRSRYPVDCFRRTFSLRKPVAQARLYASAHGLYDLRLNGQRIEDFVLAPGMTDYRKRIQYQSYDCTALLQAENQLELQLADGWYRGSSAAYGVTQVYGRQTSLLVQLEIQYTDGSIQTIASDEDWDWSNDGPIRFADLKDGEIYDARMRPSYSGHARLCKVKAAHLTASNNVPVHEMEHFHPRLLPNNVLDFGQNLAGYVSFRVKGSAGQRIRLICGEILDEDGNVTLQNMQEHRPVNGWSSLTLMKKLLSNQVRGEQVPTPLQTIDFTCSGGQDAYKTRFAVFGFRYVQVETDLDIHPSDFEAIAVYSDMEQSGEFVCSNPLINQLLQNTRWSMKSNYLDLPTDCPTRERMGWTGDAQIFFDTGAYLMNTAPFFRKWLSDMADAQYPNGTIPAVLPYQGVELMYKSTGVSAGWADAVYLIPYRYYKRYGDRELLEQHWPMMVKYADYLLGHLGLTDKKAAQANPYNRYTYEKGTHLGEWLEPEQFQETISAGSLPKHPEEATAYLYLCMTTMAEIAALLGHPAEQKRYLDCAAGAKAAYHHLFVQTGTLDTDRQAKLVRPLALGLLDGADKTTAQQRLVQAVEHFNHCVGTGFLSTVFLLPVLAEAGQTDTAYQLLENPNQPGWLSEVLAGATTVWEDWEGHASQNHYSPGAVCQWLFEGVAGIHPDGERRFRIAPLPGGSLQSAAASYESLYGRVESRWERTEHGTHFTITIPANSTALLQLPNGNTCELQPGTHRFDC